MSIIFHQNAPHLRRAFTAITLMVPIHWWKCNQCLSSTWTRLFQANGKNLWNQKREDWYARKTVLQNSALGYSFISSFVVMQWRDETWVMIPLLACVIGCFFTFTLRLDFSTVLSLICCRCLVQIAHPNSSRVFLNIYVSTGRAKKKKQPKEM